MLDKPIQIHKEGNTRPRLGARGEGGGLGGAPIDVTARNIMRRTSKFNKMKRLRWQRILMGKKAARYRDMSSVEKGQGVSPANVLILNMGGGGCWINLTTTQKSRVAATTSSRVVRSHPAETPQPLPEYYYYCTVQFRAGANVSPVSPCSSWKHAWPL